MIPEALGWMAVLGFVALVFWVAWIGRDGKGGPE